MSSSPIKPCPGPLDLTDPVLRADPYPLFRWYRENDPVHLLEPANPGGVRRFLITRWEDMEAGLKNTRLKREVHKTALWNQEPSQVDPAFATYASVMRCWPLFKDPPSHAPLRRPVNRVLDRAMNEAAAPLLDRVISSQLAALAPLTEFDAITSFAQCIPLELDRQLFGLETLDAAGLGNLLQVVGLALGNVFDPDRIRQASSALDVLTSHLKVAMTRCRQGSVDAPMLSKLLSLAEPGGSIDQDQIIPLAILLIQAAQDSVVGSLSNGLITFLRNPEALAFCLATPDGFHRAVDEVLRFESPVQQITRHASEDLQIRGVSIRAGEGVSFLPGAANRDPEVFENPDVFQPDRRIARTAAFGFGPHTCPGMDLGRRIAAEAWRGFFTQFPKLVFPSPDETCWRPTVTFRTLAKLPVRVQVQV